MRFKQTGNMVVEAIAHQGRSMLFRELEAAIQKIKDMDPKGVRKQALTEVGVDKIIAKHTNLNCPCTIVPEDIPNAWVEPPYLDVNHALLDDMRRGWIGDENDWIDGNIVKVFGKKTELVGSVNRETSKVTGAFAEIPCPISVTRGLINNQKFTAGMIAYIILHEVGHVFTYFEFFGRMATFNGALQASAEAFFKCDTREDRLKVIRATSEVFEAKQIDAESLVASKNKETYVLTFARSYLIDRNASMGSSTYDMTLWESQADMFAMRHGAGLDGINAMAMLTDMMGGATTRSMVTHLILSLLKILLFLAVAWFSVAGGAFGFIPFLLGILMIDPSKKIYDDPRARLDRMRRDMVAGLKSNTLSKDYRAKLVADIKTTDDLLKKYDDKRGVMEFFYTSILPSGRRQYAQRAFQLEMEKLVANDLLVAAASLDLLKR